MVGISSRIEGERADAAEAAQRRQRTPMNDAAARVLTAKQLATEATAAPRDRRALGTRKPFGSAEQQLAYPPIPGFRLYWFNDAPGRVARATEAGYEHVTESGQSVCRNVGKGEHGGGIKAYLMKIPMEWYNQDMAASQEELERRLNDIKSGRFGAIKGQNQYVPGDRPIIVNDERR